jgi:UDP-3-O-[3-hydroxymyristoyl] glucosamine N-acyltransferase
VVSASHPVPSGSFPAIIAVEETRMALAKLTALFDLGPSQDTGVHPTALVAADAELGAGVSIGAYAVVGPRSQIGAGTRIMPHVSASENADCFTPAYASAMAARLATA